MITRTITITPSPTELAMVFAVMGGDQQARFFSALAAESWWPMQLTFVRESPDLTEDGRVLMELIGANARKEVK